MNLCRLGHYHTPGADGTNGTCQTALVVFVNEAPDPDLVNLVVWTHDGEDEKHTGVPWRASLSGERSAELGPGASFHLCADCPFGR